MLDNLKFIKVLWLIPTFLAFIAAAGGLLNSSIYNGLFPEKYIAVQFSQDWLTLFVCITVFIMILKTKNTSYRLPIIIIGIIGSLAYLYAIFSIERVYNWYYFIYLVIVSSSFFAVIYSLSKLNKKFLSNLKVPSGILKTNIIFSLIIALLFSLLWIGALVPLIQQRDQIDNLYSIYFLDLVFVMPMFVISAIMAIRKNSLSYVYIPVMFILGIFVIFPLGLGELAKPRYGLEVDVKSMMMSFILAGFFASGAALQLSKTVNDNQKIKKKTS